jgi:hypothetical protein
VMPCALPARDSQTIKLSAFSIRRMDSHKLPEGMYGPPVPPFWQEHPTATFLVKGVGKLKARLSRPLPEGHVPVELHLTCDADGHVSLAIVSRGPASRKAVDTEAVAQSIREAVRHLAEGAGNWQAYQQGLKAAKQRGVLSALGVRRPHPALVGASPWSGSLVVGDHVVRLRHRGRPGLVARPAEVSTPCQRAGMVRGPAQDSTLKSG